MLRITMNKSAAGAKKYYSEEYYNEGISREAEYYSEKDQVIGTWGGKGAERLGLVGDIRKLQFGFLCDNINPETGKKLTARNDAERTVGYDFTINACKSVSLAYTFASEKVKHDILTAFGLATDDMMIEIEKGMQGRVRAKGKNENRETENIVYGGFTHFTTRPIDGLPDPHLHKHLFVFNATFDNEDNKWKAGQFKQIIQDAPYYEAYFHSRFAEELEKLGYSTRKTKDGFELAGVDKSVADKFSRRTKEIEEYAKEHGITDDKQKSKIGAKTREDKRADISPEQQYQAWESRLTHEELQQLKNLKSNNSGNASNDNNNLKAAKAALQYSLDHHLERKSVASDKEILATAIKSSIGNASAKQIISELNGSKDIFSIKEDHRTFITTKAALSEEKKLIQIANMFKGKFKPINENYSFKSDILNNQQKKAVVHTLSTSDGIVIIAGKAGTGKTTLMKEVKTDIEEAGKMIFCCAPSAEASRGVQRSEGFENAETVATLIQNKSLHPQFHKQVIWIDEAGMLSNKDLNKILEIASTYNARVILSGDTKQHNSVERGDALRILQKYTSIISVTVNKIQRQKDSVYKQAVKYFSESDIEKGFKKLEQLGAVKEITDSKERIKAVAEDYFTSACTNKAKKVLVVAPTHAEGETVTNEIRNKLKENKVIDNDELEYKILKNLQYTKAELLNPDNYKQGDFLSFYKNAKGIKAGSRLQIAEVKGMDIITHDKNGKEYTVPVSKSKSYNVFEEKKIQVTKGERIRITGNGYTTDGKHLFNGNTFSITGFDKQGNIRLSNGSTLEKNYRHFNFGYVITSHASQGKTADKIIISQSSCSFRASSSEQFYVSVSRGKEVVSIYTDDKETLKQAISQSTQRQSAMEPGAQTKNCHRKGH